jgi:hypothetical protein
LLVISVVFQHTQLSFDAEVFLEEIRDTVADEVVADDGTDVSDVAFSPLPFGPRKAAAKFSLMARAKVGRLSVSKANELVYQKTLLRLFEEYNVRYSAREEILPAAIMACFVNGKEWDLLDEILECFRADPEGRK